MRCRPPVLSRMLIYKIISPNTDLVYVGKTDQTLSRRLSEHRSAYKGWLAGTCIINYSSFKVLEHGDYSIEMIEETEDKKRERFWIKELNACNTYTMSVEFDFAAHCRAHYVANREAILERSTEYRDANRETINKKQNEKVPCSNCGAVMNRSSIWAHKKRNVCQNS